jgi:hypothetical protein
LGTGTVNKKRWRAKSSVEKRRKIMKSKSYSLVAACLLGSVLVLPTTILSAEKDMMKDDKGMMKESKDAKMRDKMKKEDKMKMDDKKMDEKKM